jgi:branched-chain amino acid transport system ATP-binding protein
LAADALVLDGVHAHYGRSHVLHGVSLRVRRGGVLALLGRNGAGKTTTMMAIAGLLKPSAGRIAFEGRAIQALAPEAIARSGVRLVPQGRRLFPSLSVQENLSVAARRKPGPREWTAERVYELFPLLKPRVRQRAGTLSGGEQQMLAIGRGLMAEPELLILDEPSLGLSPLLVEELFALIRRINSEGITLLVVEQNVVQCLEVARRAYILEDGMFVLHGNSADIRDDPNLKRAFLGL